MEHLCVIFSLFIKKEFFTNSIQFGKLLNLELNRKPTLDVLRNTVDSVVFFSFHILYFSRTLAPCPDLPREHLFTSYNGHSYLFLCEMSPISSPGPFTTTIGRKLCQPRVCNLFYTQLVAVWSIECTYSPWLTMV